MHDSTHHMEKIMESAPIGVSVVYILTCTLLTGNVKAKSNSFQLSEYYAVMDFNIIYVKCYLWMYVNLLNLLPPCYVHGVPIHQSRIYLIVYPAMSWSCEIALT